MPTCPVYPSGLMAEDEVVALAFHCKTVKTMGYGNVLTTTKTWISQVLGHILNGCRSNGQNVVDAKLQERAPQDIEPAAFIIFFRREIAASSICPFVDQTGEECVCASLAVILKACFTM